MLSPRIPSNQDVLNIDNVTMVVYDLGWFSGFCYRAEMNIDDHLIASFLDKQNIIAVVGVSDSPSKYGNRVFFDLLGAGYKTYAVHPDGGTIGGQKRYPDLRSLPERPDVVDIVVPPAVTEQIVKECNELGIDKVWMQPGSESQTAIEYCERNGISVLHEVCIMVQRKRV